MKLNKRGICCAAGGILMGFFSNQLNTVIGCILFSLGIALLGGAILLSPKKEKDPEEEEK